MYCKVEECIYNVSSTCGIDTEIDENGKCVWISRAVEGGGVLIEPEDVKNVFKTEGE